MTDLLAQLGEKIRQTIAASNPGWTKWRPSDPTSPHWYDEARLSRLMAAHIAHAEDHGQTCPTVRKFISEFRGLSATAKERAICEAISASRASLAEFYGGGESARIAGLLAEMRKASRPVKPRDLGAIGKDHLAAKSESLGVAPETFNYGRADSSINAFPISPKPPLAIAQMAKPFVSGRRVELNAMTSDQFIAFVEGKLTEHGITKVIPAKETLDQTFRLFERGERIREAVDELIEANAAESVDVPADLEQRVRGYLIKNPAEAWEDAVRRLVEIIGMTA